MPANVLRHGDPIVKIKKDPLSGEDIGVATEFFQRFLDELGKDSEAIEEVENRDDGGMVDNVSVLSAVMISNLKKDINKLNDDVLERIEDIDQQIGVDMIISELKRINDKLIELEQLI